MRINLYLDSRSWRVQNFEKKIFALSDFKLLKLKLLTKQDLWLEIQSSDMIIASGKEVFSHSFVLLSFLFALEGVDK